MRRRGGKDCFDAVVVANGRFEVSVEPEVVGADVFPGKIMHSHWYKDPTDFK